MQGPGMVKSNTKYIKIRKVNKMGIGLQTSTVLGIRLRETV